MAHARTRMNSASWARWYRPTESGLLRVPGETKPWHRMLSFKSARNVTANIWG